jgi:hypothetical protein
MAVHYDPDPRPFRFPREPFIKRIAKGIRKFFVCETCGSGNITMFGVCLDCMKRDINPPGPTFKFGIGEKVSKLSGDYQFKGWIVSRWHKRGKPDAIRYDVENPDGIVHIFNEKQLTRGWPQDWIERKTA